MPSSYTANGGIELPANGEQSGTWGETVNDNMSIIDRLTNGVGSIALSGTTHTLTTNNGSLSEGQYKVLLLGGAPSGTNTVTVSPNTGQHIYIVKNSSGQTATFTQGSGGNVSVLNGTTKILSTNGAGGGAAVVDITAAVDLGSLIIGGTTVTSSAAELNILDGVTATAAELNILDGVTASTAELNILDGVTASTAEINILAGATLSTAELNYVDGVTSAIQTQIDTKAPSASPTLTTPTLASVITITGGTQSWTVTAAGTNLTFAYNGTNVMRVDSTGNITAIGNVTAYGSVV
jgi:energy-converting hydrogenase Eha subunit G